MNLLQIRTKFRELSGRYDLVNTDFSDNGADFYINEGCKYLDRSSTIKKSYASTFKFIDINKSAVFFSQCRAIKEVWIMSTTSRWRLEKKSLKSLTSEYLSSLSRSSGNPLYYAPAISRYTPEDATADSTDFASYIGWVDIQSTNASESNSILLNTPVQEKLVIEIRGLFYSAQLLTDTGSNYWSESHAGLLLKAALRELEIFSQNPTKVRLWDSAIAIDLIGLDKDFIEEDIVDITQIEG